MVIATIVASVCLTLIVALWAVDILNTRRWNSCENMLRRVVDEDVPLSLWVQHHRDVCLGDPNWQPPGFTDEQLKAHNID